MSRAARASGRPSRVWEDVETRVTDADASLTPEAASDRATRWLRSLIISGELGPGDWFPPERILAEKLGISRLTLRTALKTLEGTGYIVTERGVAGGSRVNDASALLQCWTQWMLFQSEDLEDILEMRRTIETRIAVLAARMRTTDELRAMEAAVAREWAVAPISRRCSTLTCRSTGRLQTELTADASNVRWSRRARSSSSPWIRHSWTGASSR